MAIPIRPAEPRDQATIAEFTHDTFPWGDYVADSFVEWLDDPGTEVVVACAGDRPIALARVRMLGPREGWLSAARVHPQHRRRGIGSALNDWCAGWVGEQGGVVARLQIETWNEPAHHQVVGLGYRPVAEVVNAHRSTSTGELTPATNGGRRRSADERLDRAPRVEAEGAYIAWSGSELAQAAHGLFPVDRWAWRRMTLDDVHQARTWYCPSGWVVAEDEGDELTVRWIVTNPEDVTQLVRAAIDLAHERHASGLHTVAPRVAWLTEVLAEHGFELAPSRIYEKAL